MQGFNFFSPLLNLIDFHWLVKGQLRWGVKTCGHVPGTVWARDHQPAGWGLRTVLGDCLPLVRLERKKETSDEQLRASLFLPQSRTFYFQSVTTYTLRVCQLFTFLPLSSQAFFAGRVVLPVFTEGYVLCLQELSGRRGFSVFFLFLFMICMILFGSSVAACRVFSHI